jgi:DNA-directed RNA polymerase specialized sigma24 family protein
MPNQDSQKTAKSAEKFVVRLPPGMRRRIADAARCYRRSMNSEIVARLEQSLDSGTAPYPVTEPIPAATVEDAPAAEAPATGVLPTEAAEAAQEDRLLSAFRNLSPERRRALLALLD